MTTKPSEAMFEAGDRALMLADGCGLTIEGERVMCTDPRARIPATDCICRDGARAAIEAAFAAAPILRPEPFPGALAPDAA